MNKFSFIDKQMEFLKIPYEFDEWTQKIRYPYSVGELPSPEEITTEDGKEEQPFIITLFHRGKKSVLEEIKEKIKNHFHPIAGLRGETDNGAIIVFYEGAFYVPTGEDELKKMQINLKILEWKGDF